MKKGTKKTITKKSATPAMEKGKRKVSMEDIIAKTKKDITLTKKELGIKKLAQRDEIVCEVEVGHFKKALESYNKRKKQQELITLLSSGTAIILKLAIFYWGVNVIANAVIRVLY